MELEATKAGDASKRDVDRQFAHLWLETDFVEATRKSAINRTTKAGRAKTGSIDPLTGEITGVYAAASHSHSYDDISCSGKFKSPGYQTEAIALSGITTIGWVPAYDCSGNYIGKIPVFT